MANRRTGKGLLNNNSTQSDSVPSGAPLFDIEEDKEAVETEKKEIADTENDILKEIQAVMAEGAYNKGEEAEIKPVEEDFEVAQVSSDIPLENKEENKDFEDKAGSKEKVLSQKALERKAKREAKKAAYKKTTFKHKIFVMCVLMVLGIFTGSGLGVWYFNFALKSNVDWSAAGNPSDYQYTTQDIDAVLTKNFSGINTNDRKNWVEYALNLGKTPSDLSPVENFVLAQYNATNVATSYTAIGEGTILNSVSSAPQKLYSEKKFSGQKYSFVSISPSTVPAIVPDVAVCDILEKGKSEILSYEGPILEGDKSAAWSYKTTYDMDAYSNLTGVSVNDIQPYLICGKEGYSTVLSSSEITIDENGNYVFTLELDTIKSVLNYVKQVKRTGGLASFPEFDYIKYTITMNGNWQFVKASVEEQYKATKMGLKPTINGTLTTFFTFNEPVTPPIE